MKVVGKTLFSEWLAKNLLNLFLVIVFYINFLAFTKWEAGWIQLAIGLADIVLIVTLFPEDTIKIGDEDRNT